MNEQKPDADTIRMLGDYMENGFLENIIDMFRHDPSLWGAVPQMITDERSRVRIGTIALAETFFNEHRDAIIKAIPDMAEGLKHPEPTIRGDVVFLLDTLGLKEAVPYLKDAHEKEDTQVVRDEMEETLNKLECC